MTPFSCPARFDSGHADSHFLLSAQANDTLCQANGSYNWPILNGSGVVAHKLLMLIMLEKS
jgi:hypothetical protein